MRSNFKESLIEEGSQMKEEELVSLREDLKDELLAINNYQVHINASKNAEHRKLLGHIRDEEKEHVAEIVKLLRKYDKTENIKFEEEGL